jgi:Asp-tRNA(Asn)/Glu-tRNA(Gln) amidotransferase A subunit family amidase
MPKQATEPCHLSAVEARRLIGLKKLSPVELMESCLKRIDATNPAVNAIVVIDKDAAMKQAREAEQLVVNGGTLDVLTGLPVGIKDLNPVEGMRSTWGSLIFKDHIPEADDPMVANVRVSGGLPFCKTNVPEFGAGANTINRVFGATGNPFDPKLTCAGSSGGSAVALALDMMPLATGSDYGGSLRTPASFCGVTGFRTSPGLVPSPDKAAGLIPWGVNGPMGRTMEDAYMLLRAQVALDRGDPFSSMDAYDWPEKLVPADLSMIRAAITPDFGQAPIDKMIRSVFNARAQKFGKVFLDASETCPDYAGVHDVFEIHRGLSFATGHQEKLAKHRDLLDRNVIDNTERGLKLTMSEIGRGFVEQHKLHKRVTDFFDDYDVMIAPAASVSPFPHSKLFIDEINGKKLPTYMTWLAISYIPTMTLCCAAAIPCGRDELGMPFGIQVIGPKGHDRRVFEIAMALEQALQDNPETARPIPDAILKAASTSKAAKAPAKKAQ